MAASSGSHDEPLALRVPIYEEIAIPGIAIETQPGGSYLRLGQIGEESAREGHTTGRLLGRHLQRLTGPIAPAGTVMTDLEHPIPRQRKSISTTVGDIGAPDGEVIGLKGFPLSRE